MVISILSFNRLICTLILLSFVFDTFIFIGDSKILNFDKLSDASGWHGKYMREPIGVDNLSDYVLKWDSKTKNISVFLKNIKADEDGEIRFSWMKSGTFASSARLNLYVDGTQIELSDSAPNIWKNSSYIIIPYDPQNLLHNISFILRGPIDGLNCYSFCSLRYVEMNGLDIADSTCGNFITDTSSTQEIINKIKTREEITILNENGNLRLNNIFELLYKLQLKNESKVSTILLGGGDYVANQICINASKFTLRAKENEVVNFDGEGYDYSLYLNSVSSVTIKDILFSKSYNGIIMENSTGCVISDNDVGFVGGTGICIFNSTRNNLIDNNLYSDASSSSGIWSRNSSYNTYNRNSINVSNILYYLDKGSHNNSIYIMEEKGNVSENDFLYWVSCEKLWLCNGARFCDGTADCINCRCTRIGDRRIQLNNLWTLT